MFIQYQKEKMELPEGSSGKDLAEKLNLRDPSQSLGMILNGVTRDLGTVLQEGDEVELLHFDSLDGKELFWHSSAHVLAQAILRLYPEAKPTIGPPIENGFYYDFADLTLSEEDFPKIEKEVAVILKENFKPERYVFSGKEEALERFNDNPYKQELIREFDGQITAYSQGEFFDLCRGPHLPALGKIKAFKVLKTSGAYWRADKEREMLTRVYGISFPSKQELKDYIFRLEEAKKRDHKVIGPKLDLFSMKEEAPGIPFIQPKGMIVWNRLLGFLRELLHKNRYVEIQTPQLMSDTLWKRSGHWDYYRENMYAFEVEERHFALKPMNCPGCMLFYKSKNHSYREFPLRVAEIGHVFRHELSGSLNGLFRVRSFHQDDAHIFMRGSDIKNEILGTLKFAEAVYEAFGLKYRFELSTRPEKSIGTDEDWDQATRGLKDALDDYGHTYDINAGDGAFYGPKIDIHIFDALGRSWQCGTIQLDMSLPEKFELEYMDSDGALKRPIMIHRTIFGSVERFFGTLIEHFAGKFPLWLSPRPVRLIPVSDRHVPYAETCQKAFEAAGILCEIDASNESVSKKVREAQLLQVNYMLTIGDKELENQTLNVRRRDNIVCGEVEINSLIDTLRSEIESRSLTPKVEKQADEVHNS